MDKNNDIQVNKVDKWCAGVADVNLWQAKKSVDIFLCCYSPMLSIEALDAVRTIYVALDEALDRFNELEARHQKDTGMISEYEEENRDLKSELDIKTDECDDLISRVIRQDIEYAKLETENEELRSKCETQEDKECSEFRNDSLLKALNQVGIRPSFDIRANKWLIQYTDKAENAFLAADQIKRNAEKRVEAADNKIKELEKKLKSAEDCYEVYRNSYERTANDVCKLQEFLEKCGVPVKYRNDDTWYWDFENSAWDDTLMKDCKLIDKCRELEKENNNLTTDNKRLSNAVEAWFDMFNDMRHKRDLLKKEYEKLKETNKSCPVACECENFKPKVHHSYDPLDDLPDMEHS